MGLYFRRKLDNDVEISVWKITETEEELLADTSVPSEELEDLAFTRNPARRREKLAVRALLNTIFDEKVYLGHHDNGKPFIQNSIVEISISHTKDFVAIITHPEDCVGIDIESLNRNFENVEERVLSEEEREDLSTKERNLHLAIYWSAKEAVFKLMSRMSVDFAEQIRIEKFSPKDEGDLEAVFVDKDGVEYEIELSYEIFDGHVMVWTCEL